MTTTDPALKRLAAIHYRSLFPASSGSHKGEHFCPGCTVTVDSFTAYVPWPCPTWQAVTAPVKAAPPAESDVQVRQETARVGLELMAARVRGDVARGGPNVDDATPAGQWLVMLGGQLTGARVALGRAAAGVTLGGDAREVLADTGDLAQYRAHLVSLAELACSAIEAFDRLSQ